MQPRGLGDTIENFKKLANSIPGGCGCSKRRDALNKVFPYKK